MAGLESKLNSTLKLRSDDAEVARLLQENQDLKRQLAGGGFSAASCQIAWEELDVQDQVGGGGFSVVHRALWRGTPVAVKKWFDPQHTDQLMQEFREEVMTLQELRHPNVLQFLGAVMKPPNLAMVTEHMPFSLHGVLYGPQAVADLDRRRVVAMAQDAARAFVYLHSRRPPVVHRDIKPANFLVDRAWKVKVCDFGLASNNKAQAGAGTPAYMAPELLDNKPYNEKVDVYAFGVLLCEMLARQAPYAGLPLAELRARVLAGGRPEVPLTCPRALQDIITSCWDADPAKRPSFERVLELLKEADKQMARAVG